MMIFVTSKEIRLLLRSRSAFSFLLLALGLVGGIFALLWATEAVDSSGMVRGRAMMGRNFFGIVSAIQLCAMGIISPLMAATTVTSERENKTLDLLLSTGLPRVRLLLGKWLATIFYQIVLLVCLLPILSLVFQLGGVGLDEYLFAAVMIAMTVLTYGMLGLAFSCLFRRSLAALTATLITVLFLTLGLPIGLALLNEFHFIHFNTNEYRTGLILGPFESLFWCVSPAMTWLAHLMETGMTGGMSTPSALSINPVFIAHCFIQAAIFIFSLLAAWLGFTRRESERARIAHGVIDDPAELARRRRRWPYYLIDPLRRTQEIGDGQNPVTVKEQRVGALARPHVMIRLGYLCLPLSALLLMPFFDGGPREMLQGGGTFALTLIMLFVPIFAATAISREREEKTFDMLRTTPLTSGQIVRAKFFITLRLAGVIAVGLLLMPFLIRFGSIFLLYRINMNATLTDRFYFDFLFPACHLCALIFVYSALFIALGLYFSSVLRRSVSALTLTYLSIALLTYLPTLIYDFYRSFKNSNHFGFWWDLGGPFLGAVLKYIAPLVSHTYFLFWDHDDYIHAYVTWGATTNYPPGNLYPSYNPLYQPGPWHLVLIHLALVLGLVWLLLWRAARRLSKERL